MHNTYLPADAAVVGWLYLTAHCHSSLNALHIYDSCACLLLPPIQYPIYRKSTGKLTRLVAPATTQAESDSQAPILEVDKSCISVPRAAIQDLIDGRSSMSEREGVGEAATAVTKPTRRIRVTAKSVAAKSVAARSVAAKSVAAKSVAAKSVAAKSVAAKSVAAKCVAAKSVAAKSVAARAAPKSRSTSQLPVRPWPPASKRKVFDDVLHVAGSPATQHDKRGPLDHSDEDSLVTSPQRALQVRSRRASDVAGWASSPEGAARSSPIAAVSATATGSLTRPQATCRCGFVGDSKAHEQAHGPLPSNPRLFQGLCVVMSKAVSEPSGRHSRVNVAGGGGASTTPSLYHQQHVITQVQLGGGTILQSLEPAVVASSRPGHLLLISEEWVIPSLPPPLPLLLHPPLTPIFSEAVLSGRDGLRLCSLS